MKNAAGWIEQYRAFWETQFDALEKYLEATAGKEKKWQPPSKLQNSRSSPAHVRGAPRKSLRRVGPARAARAMDVQGRVGAHRDSSRQDIRTGGRYMMEVRDPRKKETYWGRGLYREVKPPQKIVFSWSWTKDTQDGPQLHPDSPETQVTVEFFVRGNSTEVVLTHAVFGSAKDRDEAQSGLEPAASICWPKY